MKTYNGINYKYGLYGQVPYEGTKFIRYFEDQEYKDWTLVKHGVCIRTFVDGVEYADGHFSEHTSKFKELTYNTWSRLTVDRIHPDSPCVYPDVLKQEPIIQRMDALGRGARSDLYWGDEMKRYMEHKDKVLNHYWNPVTLPMSELKKLNDLYDTFNNYKQSLSPKFNDIYLCLDDGTTISRDDYKTMRKLIDPEYKDYDDYYPSNNDNDLLDSALLLNEEVDDTISD
tara:strand:- start:96 stop:779 length:684 start_codon:yes stop_codon:yes gene_type:complete